MKYLKTITLIFLFYLTSINIFYAQKNSNNDLSNEEIEKNIDKLHNDSTKVWNLINFYIKNSKKNHNSGALLYAYRYASNLSNYPNNIKYADSALQVGIKSKDKKLLTEAYLNKGVIYMGISKYQNALDNILIANNLSKQLDDDYTIFNTKYFIAQNKIYLGLYEDANKELVQCYQYFKKNSRNPSALGKNYEMYYLYTLMCYIDSNTKLGKHKENKILIDEANEYIETYKLSLYKPYFISCEGVDKYFSKKYKEAISKLSEAIKLYNDQWPHITDVFYIGLANWKMGKQGVAVKYLEEIDKEYSKSKKLNPEFRSAYELLIKYNDSIGNKDKQLEYINKLMALDKNYETNYKYLYTKLNKEYDSQKLLEEKNKIENSLKTQRTIISFILIFTLLTSLFFWYRYYKLQKKYKEKFEKILAEKPKPIDKPFNIVTKINKKISITAPKNSKELEYYNKIQGLNPILVQKILQQLNVFENEQKFTDNQMSLRLLSEDMDTNIPYLSKIINVYKGKSFNHYINDLRIDYIIDILKNDATYLNFDIKDLATMAGFTSAINFSDNFQRKYEIKPSYFIKMMKENIKTHHQ